MQTRQRTGMGRRYGWVADRVQTGRMGRGPGWTGMGVRTGMGRQQLWVS